MQHSSRFQYGVITVGYANRSGKDDLNERGSESHVYSQTIFDVLQSPWSAGKGCAYLRAEIRLAL